MNVVHTNIVGNRALLVNLLIKRKVPMHKACRMLKVKYGSLINQCRKLLTSKELDFVLGNRPRTQYSDQERLMILSCAQIHGNKVAAKEYGVHPNLITTWMRKHRQRAAE